MRALQIVLCVAVLFLSGCWWIWEDASVVSTTLDHDSLIYDTTAAIFYSSDSVVVSDVSVHLTSDLAGSFRLIVQGMNIPFTGSGTSYVATVPLDSLFDTLTVNQRIPFMVEQEGEIVDTQWLTIITGNVSWASFVSLTDSILYDTVLHHYFAPDSSRADTMTLQVTGVASTQFFAAVGGTSYPFVTSGDTSWVKIPTASIFGVPTAVSVKSVYLVDGMDTLADLSLSAYPGLSMILEEPYLKYAWQIGYGEAMSMQAWHVNPQASAEVYKAWETTRGAGVRVAIIDDGGFDPLHEDLAGNVVATYNAVTESTTLPAGSGHGTSVSGMIGAPNNGKGILGIAPEVELVLIMDGSSDAVTVRAFNYAKNSGAQVINCSWGTYAVSDAVKAVIQECYDAGITIIFASGNSGISLDQSSIDDESELPTVIGVGASSENNDVTTFSNYGSNLELIAPGEAVLGLDRMGASGNQSQRGVVDGNYAFITGTSYSCPVVTGVVALLLSVKPTLTPAQVRTILIESAQKVGGTQANYVSGFDATRHYGKVDATAALLEAQSY